MDSSRIVPLIFFFLFIDFFIFFWALMQQWNVLLFSEMLISHSRHLQDGGGGCSVAAGGTHCLSCLSVFFHCNDSNPLMSVLHKIYRVFGIKLSHNIVYFHLFLCPFCVSLSTCKLVWCQKQQVRCVGRQVSHASVHLHHCTAKLNGLYSLAE